MKRTVSLLLTLALCCLMIPAVAESASLAGTWYIARATADGAETQVVDPKAITLDIREDGTFTLTTSTLGDAQSGAWTVTDDTITLAFGEESTSTFLISGDELVYQMDATTICLSRTPPEAEILPAAVAAESVYEFDGNWTPCAQVSMGLYMALSPDKAASSAKLSIENGKVSVLYDYGDGQLTTAETYDFTFADGIMTAEDNTFLPTAMKLAMLEDGTMCYDAVMSMGTAVLETIVIYIRDDEEVIAKMPEPGWVLDSVNGAVWQDDRASLEVFLEDVDNYKVLISWSSSAWETTEWVYACDYDAETQTLKARYAICDNLVYDDAGNETRTNIFEKDSEAVFSLDEEGRLVLQNAGDDTLEGKTFENIGVQDEE